MRPVREKKQEVRRRGLGPRKKRSRSNTERTDKEVQGTTEKPEEIQKMAGLPCDGRRKNPDPPGEKGATGRPSDIAKGTWLSQVRDRVYGSCCDLLGFAEV
ncbi:hypothetical protein NDU88_003780 [Pleurodeles waltl]|uniref:Uncharacterized protein n=1 Tax=Pleurodeles waltl TaxID=8319 RepID=A0AAV7NHN0_PLEWA|nr:hypothetical protein NDU88_003780 [Pleurodeles waltl]